MTPKATSVASNDDDVALKKMHFMVNWLIFRGSKFVMEILPPCQLRATLRGKNLLPKVVELSLKIAVSEISNLWPVVSTKCLHHMTLN